VILGYLPTNTFTWDKVLAKQRAAHTSLVQELLQKCENSLAVQSRGDAQLGDTQLHHDTPSSNIEEVFDQIGKDIFRTRPEMEFFARHLSGDGAHIIRASCTIEHINLFKPVCHYDMLARILLLYAWLNPGLKYVQGMNEICAPLYFLLAHDSLNIDYVEADTFYCFSLLMGRMRDVFVKSLDDEDTGMIGQTEQFGSLLQEKDGDVWRHLEDIGVSPMLYTVRWLTLMLAQELEMPDVLRVWDALLADLAHPHRFIYYLCVAMVVEIREALLAGDFSDCLRLLQNYPPIQVDTLMEKATQMRAADLIPHGLSNKDMSKALSRESAKEENVLKTALKGWWRRYSG